MTNTVRQVTSRIRRNIGSARAMNREEFDKKAAKLSDDATPEGEQARERLKKQEFLIKYHEEVTKFGRLFSVWG